MSEITYRDAMQVPQRRISLLLDDDLSVLMFDLLRAQAYRCGADPSKVVVNTEGRARDGGSDGWSPAPPIADPWLGDSESCWQFKAGEAGQPARIANEVLKPIPRDVLKRGGRFIVVTSGSTNGVEGIQARLAALREVATRNGIPSDRIEVVGSEALTSWCNDHPSIASQLAGRPEGLLRLSKWTQSEVHQVAWQSRPDIDAQIAELRRDLDIHSGKYLHLHVHGHPGVGKTRFVLELCRDAPWKDFVVYIPQASDVSVTRLIDGVANDAGAALTVVVDEVQYDQLRPMRDALDYAKGRVRLITIGHSDSPEPARIQPIRVSPLTREALSHIILGWYPSMPREHVEFVANFADGYVRLARLAADAVAQNSNVDVKGLLDQAHIREFLGKMLGGGNRRSLYVVAALASVGWTEDREAEGRAIATHLGMDWSQVQADVETFHRSFGIAPRGGRLRYLSPTPLAIHLAAEAWDTYPDKMRSLPEALPNDAARDAYYDRLQSIASSPQARKFARSELDFFFRADSFANERAARRWSALTYADPSGAAHQVMRTLRSASIEERTRIADNARSVVVWALVRLAWRADCFFNATLSLALLAEAENASWSNNSTGEFVERFQLRLGGTAVPYMDRLPVLDELLSIGRDKLDGLVVRALAQVGNQNESRIGGPDSADQAPEPEWQPTTSKEYIECVQLACARLSEIAKSKPNISDELVKAAAQLSMLLRYSPVRGAVSDFYRTMRASAPDTREALRREIAEVLEREKEYWRELPESEVLALSELHNEFTDRSLSGRLRQYVGPSTWDNRERPDLDSLATDLLEDSESLRKEWQWLTSGEAGDGWRFGEALARVDVEGRLEKKMFDLPGRGTDLRIISAYVASRRRQQGDAWFESLMEEIYRRGGGDMRLYVDLFWRVGATESTAKIFERLLQSHPIDSNLLGQLGFGNWQANLSKETLLRLLRELVRKSQSGVAAAVLCHRIKDMPEETSWWEPLSLELAKDPTLIRSDHMASHYWQELALPLLGDHSKEIVEAILREQATKGGANHWFVEFSQAKKVLDRAVSLHPDIVWDAVAPLLSDRDTSARFHVGFPSGLVDKIPIRLILDWIKMDPTRRASVIARIAGKDLSTDETLASQVIGCFGDDAAVAGSFFSHFVSGSWMGEASVHWESLANQLDSAASRTTLPKLREWAAHSAARLRRMAEEDRVREEEEKIRHH